MKFLFAVFLPTFPFIYFGDFCQTPRLLHPPRLLFWPKFASLPVYSALPFYLKLESNSKRWFSKLKSFLHKVFQFWLNPNQCKLQIFKVSNKIIFKEKELKKVISKNTLMNNGNICCNEFCELHKSFGEI